MAMTLVPDSIKITQIPIKIWLLPINQMTGHRFDHDDVFNLKGIDIECIIKSI